MRSQSLNFSKLPDRSLEIISKLLRQSGTSPSNSLINIRPQECELCDITSIFMSLFHPKMHPPPPWLTVTPRKLFLLLFLLLSFLFLFFPFFFLSFFFVSTLLVHVHVCFFSSKRCSVSRLLKLRCVRIISRCLKILS